MKIYYTYILANASRMLYVGVTNDLLRRMSEHRLKLVPGYSARYNITRLMYYESYHHIDTAIEREKEIKGWARSKKEELIRTMNPDWNDLCAEWFIEIKPVLGQPPLPHPPTSL